MSWIIDVVSVVASPIGARGFEEHRAARLREQGHADVALRVVSGSQAGFGGRWTPALVTPRPGRLVVRRLLGRVRLWRGRPLELWNVSVSASQSIVPAGRAGRWLRHDSFVVELQTATASLQVAAAEDQLVWLTEELQG